jgi:hypothetical protein
MYKNDLSLLFVRYAPGAAGNFLISLLQTSNKLAHWSTEVENSKNTPDFENTFKQWFSHCFQPDLENHLKFEPHHPYQLDFFSSKHPRGDDIDCESFVDLLKQRNDQLFLNNIKHNKLTTMRLNKTNIPLFGYGSSVVNVIVDPAAKKWFFRTRFVKLFGQNSSQWISKENHPEFLSAKYKKIVFQNQYEFAVSKFTFLKDFVIGDPAIQCFFDSIDLTADSSNNNCSQYFINLTTLLNRDQLLKEVVVLFEQLNLGDPNLDLIGWAFDRYYQTNIAPIGIT